MNVNGFLLPIQSYSNIEKIEAIFFQQTPELSDSKGASYSGDSPIGSTEPAANYAYSNSRSISLTLEYTAISKKYDQRWIAQQISRLMALVYPIYQRGSINSKSFTPPPMVLLNYGNRYINLPCKVLDYSTSTSKEDVIEVVSNLPLKWQISLNLQVSYPFGHTPGHDDIATKFSYLDPSGGKGDAMLKQMYSNYTTNDFKFETDRDIKPLSTTKSYINDELKLNSRALTTKISKITFGEDK